MKKDIRDIKKMREKGRFAVDKTFNTDNLVQEITAQISANTASAVLVLFTIEWALYLKELGYTNITVGADDPIIENICKKRGLRYIGINDLENNKNMKFDVVVGNPPYQNGENSNFYKDFVELAKERSDQVAFVVPSSMFKNLSEFTGITDYSFKGTAFTGIQLVVSWFIWQRGFAGDCTVHFGNNINVVNTEFYIAPTIDAAQFQLVNSLLAKKLPGLNVQMGKLSRNKAIENNAGPVCIWSAGRKDQDFDKINIDPSLVPYLNGIGKHKVVFSGDYTTTAIGPAKYAIPEYGCALKAHFIEVNTRSEAEIVISYLNSKFVRYIIPVIKGTSTKNGKTVFKMIPAIDFTRAWTDAELYAHFNLTQDEIDLIESTVK